MAGIEPICALKRRCTFSRKDRIAKRNDFDAVFRRGAGFPGRLMVMWVGREEKEALRLGVVASKRSLRRSVDRSRAKRLLREAYRLNRFRLRGACDIVLVARRAILGAIRSDVEREMIHLAERAGVLESRETDRGKAGNGGV